MKRDLQQLHVDGKREGQASTSKEECTSSEKALCLGAGGVAAMAALFTRGARPALSTIRTRLGRASFPQGDDEIIS